MKRLFAAILFSALPALALSPSKSLTQYTRSVWTQEHGLPQDTIRAIAQTPDGYLWAGTDEGLARFDGYEFVVFTKENSALPSNLITALAAAPDGTLWVGTASGLGARRDRRFRVYTTRDGLSDDTITALAATRDGTLWVVAGAGLSHFEAGRFRNFVPGRELPIAAVRTVYEDPGRTLWVAGYGAILRYSGGRFEPVTARDPMQGDLVVNLLKDRAGDLWMAGSKGLAALHPDGSIRRFTSRDGLPNPFVRALWQDRDGNIWAGTNGGLARFRSGRFTGSNVEGGRQSDWVRSIFEDREGDLWVGMNSGLNRFRDDVFTIYAKTEGLPSDEPTVAFADSRGRVWVGFHDAGLGVFTRGGFRTYTTRNGLGGNEVFSIRETRNGDLLIGTRNGLSRMSGETFRNWIPGDELGRRLVFDAVETRTGTVLAATPAGLRELAGRGFRTLIPGGQVLGMSVVVLTEGRDGTIWAGTFARGLWRWNNGQARLFTTADGLASDQIRSLLEDAAGSLWIGTFGGGLGRLRDGRFFHFAARDGLLSDNISDVEDDLRGSLWLSTTRGICRLDKRQLEDFAAGRVKRLTPVNYGVTEGLRSAQCSPGFPVSGGSTGNRDGKLWFPTSHGLAMLDPSASNRELLAPLARVAEMTANGAPVDMAAPATLAPGSRRVQFRWAGVHLSAPERVRYSYRLDGLDAGWGPPGVRRTINYNSLRYGQYRFRVRAQLPDGPAGEASYSFTLRPFFYETAWFRSLGVVMLLAAAWWAYRLRVRRMRGRFALVFEERARLAREIHDTLAQGFVGISSQLDAVAMTLEQSPEAARTYLETARHMVRHSLTEARRSVMDLRASVLEGQALGAALQSGARMWTAGSTVELAVDVPDDSLPAAVALPQETEQHLLRIAQEAVHNAIKHAAASHIRIQLRLEPRRLCLRIEDDGRGFEPNGIFSSAGGHFGVIGMRERATRIGGELRLTSEPGRGTQVEVTVPLT